MNGSSLQIPEERGIVSFLVEFLIMYVSVVKRCVYKHLLLGRRTNLLMWPKKTATTRTERERDR